MLRQAYGLVMDPDFNPLRRLPKMVRFQYMSILAFMWSAVFTIWTGWMFVFGPSVVAHLLILVAMFFTADVFRRAQNRSRAAVVPHHRDAMRNPKDGTVLYDDLWGAS